MAPHMMWNMSLLDSRVNFKFGAVLSDGESRKKTEIRQKKKQCIAILRLNLRTKTKYKKLYELLRH